MDKTLLKILVYELFERVIRFESLLAEVAEASDETAQPLVREFQRQAALLRDDLYAKKPDILPLFSDNALGENTPGNLSAQLNALVYEPYARLCALTREFTAVDKSGFLPETHLFLGDVIPRELEASAGESAYLMSGEPVCFSETLKEFPAPATLSDAVCVETLPLLQRSNPLGWPHLIRQFQKRLAKKANLQTSDSLDFPAHCIGLRLLGPAYYFEAVLNALLGQDREFLLVQEPALFLGLNHLNFTHKSLVILHEAVEKHRETLTPGKEETLLSEETVGKVLRAVENHLPEKIAFTARSFERAGQLQDRLGQDILLSAHHVYPLNEIAGQLEQALENPETGRGIYELLNLVAETPNTPREIVNAGWLHKMERISPWLYNALSAESSAQAGDGFIRLRELIERQDGLLLKSIETSEIHRVLLCTA